MRGQGKACCLPPIYHERVSRFQKGVRVTNVSWKLLLDEEGFQVVSSADGNFFPNRPWDPNLVSCQWYQMQTIYFCQQNKRTGIANDEAFRNQYR